MPPLGSNLKLATAILSGLLVVASALAAAAGVVTPGLEARLAELAPGEAVKVLVVLRGQLDAPALAADLHLAKAGRGAAHATVVEALRDHAAAGQADLLTALEADKAAGGVRGYRPHWLINAVVVTATADAVRTLADRPDVERVEPDLEIEPIVPTRGEKALYAAGETVAAGVAAVRAPEVWHELGLDGTGVVVGIMDTGVDGHHPALAGRWRGNFAPAKECWLDAAELGDTDFPLDRSEHGTHVMGIILGSVPGDTIGVAPGAVWIAANTLGGGGAGPEFDNAVLATLEFMADPDGDPGTSDDVPAVLQNSWGINESFTDYFDCDSRWWDAIDACEAAGVVITWAAGNEGPQPGTVRSPADRATSRVNAFAVGSAEAAPPFVISQTSSRGPSGCGGDEAVKPELVAPGVSIYSARPGGGYQTLSGTSMAGPHVAGVVALMRAANPDADVITLKATLLATARDLGTPGEDNDYGYGMIDAYAAVQAVKGGIGTVSGTVRDADTRQALAGATVRLAGTLYTATTDPRGNFRLVLPEGAVDLVVGTFGYEEGARTVTVTDGGTVDGGVDLAPLPEAAVSGTVHGPDGDPVAGATVAAEGTPLAPAVTDAAGAYTLRVPLVTDAVTHLRARADGLGSHLRSLRVSGPASLDFRLPERVVEDFEGGDFSSFDWRPGGDAPWTIDPTSAWEGTAAARAGAVGDDRTSELILECQALEDDELVFRCRVDSEPGYDFLQFFMDGALRRAWSGTVPWTRYAVEVPAGPHTFRWVYAKDPSHAEGEDTAWLDFVTMPTSSQAPQPGLTVAPTEIVTALAPGGLRFITLTVGNAGDADLDFVLSPDAVPVAKATAGRIPHLDLAKGENDPRAPARAALAPPPGSGYVWSDSDTPLGPNYRWVDIAGDGVRLDLGDDDVSASLSLGFAFPFFGGSHEVVRVAANGLLVFGDAADTHLNQGLPDPSAPDGIVAAFWDDLDPDLGGTIHVRADAGRFITQFTGVPHFGAPDLPETFQVVLDDDGTITCQYASVSDGGGCSVGIEDHAGERGLQVAFNAPDYPRSGLAVRFVRPSPPPWLTVDTEAGSLPPEGSRTVEVVLDATGLAAGLHTATLAVASNDPDHAQVTIPVTLVVGPWSDGGDVPSAVRFGGAVPNPFNPETDLHFALPREAAVSLKVYDVAGRLVRTLVQGTLRAGPHVEPWNGRTDAGRPAASGTYFARLEADGTTVTRAMTLIR